MSKIRKDITGQRFGRLVALRPDYNDIRYWYFKCDCGKETRKNRNCVVMGSTKSCGCLKEQINKINLNREKIIISPGMKFNRLTAIKPVIVGTATFWLFKCDCGTEKLYRKHEVVSGHKKSCGCLLREQYLNGGTNKKYPDNITGQRFGRLVAIRQAKNYKGSHSKYWLFKCDCGKEKIILKQDVFNNTTKSCGCLRQDLMIEKKKMADDKRVKLKTSCYYSNYTEGTLSKRNKSGYVGVCYDKYRKKWRAEIMFQKKKYNLGRFENKEDAIEARKLAEKKLRGPFLEWYNETYKKSEV